MSAGNGGTWFTAPTMTSKRSWNRRMRSSSSPCTRIASATSWPVNSAPDSICATASGFISSRCSSSSGPSRYHVDHERTTRNASSAPSNGGSASSTTQPRSSNVARQPSTTARTRRSSGRPPGTGHHATRRPARSRSKGAANDAGSLGYDNGSRASMPTTALSPSPTSATERASMPFTT